MTTVTAKRVFQSSVPITWSGLTTLATSSTRLVGTGSPAIDVAGMSPPPVDILIGGRFKTASSGLSASFIDVMLAMSEDGTNHAGGAAAGANTMTAEQKALLVMLAQIQTNATASQTYEMSPVSVAKKLGGFLLPRKFIILVFQSTGGAFVSPTAMSYSPQTALSE